MNEFIEKICEPYEGVLIPFYSPNERIIISMTSWKKRIDNVSFILSKILENTVLPDLIVINLAVEEFPNKEQDLPQELNNLIKEKNGLIEINWLKYNTKVWKKIIPTLFKYPNDCIISIDDDHIYPNDFIETLYNYHLQHPDVGVSGNEEYLRKYKAHCGGGSLVKKTMFGESFSLLTKEMIDFFASDLFYTFAMYKNNNHYEYCGKLFFNNMPVYNEGAGYSNSNNVNVFEIWDKIYMPYFK